MRMLWAFDIKPIRGVKLPLNPSDYRDTMPGVPGSKLPVSLIPNSAEKSRIITEEYETQLIQRVPLVGQIDSYKKCTILLISV